MTRPPPIETREGDGQHTGSPFASLARETGLSVNEIAAIAERGELRALIESNGVPKMRRRDPRQLIVDLQAKRHPPEPKSPRQRLVEILEKRWPS
jgi:hypothetical protein